MSRLFSKARLRQLWRILALILGRIVSLQISRACSGFSGAAATLHAHSPIFCFRFGIDIPPQGPNIFSNHSRIHNQVHLLCQEEQVRLYLAFCSPYRTFQIDSSSTFFPHILHNQFCLKIQPPFSLGHQSQMQLLISVDKTQHQHLLCHTLFYQLICSQHQHLLCHTLFYQLVCSQLQMQFIL